MKLEKMLNHGVHGDKTKTYVDFVIHPLGDMEMPLPPKSLAVFAVVEMRFLR